MSLIKIFSTRTIKGFASHLEFKFWTVHLSRYNGTVCLRGRYANCQRCHAISGLVLTQPIQIAFPEEHWRNTIIDDIFPIMDILWTKIEIQNIHHVKWWECHSAILRLEIRIRTPPNLFLFSHHATLYVVEKFAKIAKDCFLKKYIKIVRLAAGHQ